MGEEWSTDVYPSSPTDDATHSTYVVVWVQHIVSLPPKECDGAMSRCQGFLLQFELYLATLRQTPSGEESVSLLVSCLSGRALDWANAVWNSPDSARDNFLEFTRRF